MSQEQRDPQDNNDIPLRLLNPSCPNPLTVVPDMNSLPTSGAQVVASAGETPFSVFSRRQKVCTASQNWAVLQIEKILPPTATCRDFMQFRWSILVSYVPSSLIIGGSIHVTVIWLCIRPISSVIYAPALPQVAEDFRESTQNVNLTITVYL